MRRTRIRLSAAFMVGATALFSAIAVPTTPAAATEVRWVVNNEAVTSYDIQRRAALLRLMQRNGNIQEIAAQEMVEQRLREQEIARLDVPVTEEMVDNAYNNFASSNSMTVAQLDRILAESGVTKGHFKGFIRTQIGWGQVVRARRRSSESLSEQDVVQRMLEQGGKKPTATEYTLQRVIFVIPSGQRSALLAKRKREAQSMRDRFQDCADTIEFAKGLVDVTVRDMGQVLEPELPPEWEEHVADTSPGNATPVRETEHGVEFIGVCSAREVSDDHVAKLVFQNQESGDETMEQLSDKLTAEMRERARIIER